MEDDVDSVDPLVMYHRVLSQAELTHTQDRRDSTSFEESSTRPASNHALFDDPYSISISDLPFVPQSTANDAAPSSPMRPMNPSPLRPTDMFLFQPQNSSSAAAKKRKLSKMVDENASSKIYTNAAIVPKPRPSPKEKRRKKRQQGKIDWADSDSGEADPRFSTDEMEQPVVEKTTSDMDLCTPAPNGLDERSQSSGLVQPESHADEQSLEATQAAEYTALPPLAESSRDKRSGTFLPEVLDLFPSSKSGATPVRISQLHSNEHKDVPSSSKSESHAPIFLATQAFFDQAAQSTRDMDIDNVSSPNENTSAEINAESNFSPLPMGMLQPIQGTEQSPVNVDPSAPVLLSGSTHIPDSEPSRADILTSRLLAQPPLDNRLLPGESGPPSTQEVANILTNVSSKSISKVSEQQPLSLEEEESIPLAIVRPPRSRRSSSIAPPPYRILRNESPETFSTLHVRHLRQSDEHDVSGEIAGETEGEGEEDPSTSFQGGDNDMQVETNYEDLPADDRRATNKTNKGKGSCEATVRGKVLHVHKPKKVQIVSPKVVKRGRTVKMAGFYKKLNDGKIPADTNSKTLHAKAKANKVFEEFSEDSEFSVEIDERPPTKKAKLTINGRNNRTQATSKSVKKAKSKFTDERRHDEAASAHFAEAEKESESGTDTSSNQIIHPTTKADKAACGLVLDTDLPILALPFQRVLVHWRDESGFYPAQITQIHDKDHASVHFDDCSTAKVPFRDLRYCYIDDGDPVQYIGEDVDTQDEVDSSQVFRVYRVEWADESGRIVPKRMELGSKVILAAKSLASGTNKVRFKLEGIKIPTKPKEFRNILDDRKLSDEDIQRMRLVAKKELVTGKQATIGAAAIVRSKGKRQDSLSNESDTRSVSVSTTSKVASPQTSRRRGTGVFAGVGFLLTGFGTEKAAADANTEIKAGHARNTQRSVITERILGNAGHIFNDVDDLFEATFGNDGRVMTTFKAVLPSIQTIICLADRPSPKARKYIMSLAIGVPCVSTRWVDVSFERGSLEPIPPFMLGAGFSIDLGWHAFGNQIKLMAPNLTFRLQDISDRFAGMQIFPERNFLVVHKSEASREEVLGQQTLCAALGAVRVEFVSAKSSETAATSFQEKCERADRILLEDGAHVPVGIPRNKQTSVIDRQYIKECLYAGRILPCALYSMD